MIAKDLEAQQHRDPLLRAGHQAEMQMAHYLKRAFGDSPDIHILNNLRLEHNGEIAQIDHLVVHRNGVIIIESKSVHGIVRINDRGEWSRGQRGMPSPILQAQRQSELLRDLLNDNAPILIGKFFGIQRFFGLMARDHLVAISDTGIIQAGRKGPAGVMKADQIPGRVKEIVQYYRTANRNPAKLLREEAGIGWKFSDDELEVLFAFLRTRHTPSTPLAADPVPAESFTATRPRLPVPTMEIPAHHHHCAKCRGVNLTLRAGRYGPYFACPCGKNTPAPTDCPVCGADGTLHATGDTYTLHCPEHITGYWTNAPHPEPTPAASAPAPMTASTLQVPACRKCGQTPHTLTAGPYGYYFKCSCGGNTPAWSRCPNCQAGTRISKAGSVHTVTCPNGHSHTYHV